MQPPANWQGDVNRRAQENKPGSVAQAPKGQYDEYGQRIPESQKGQHEQGMQPGQQQFGQQQPGQQGLGSGLGEQPTEGAPAAMNERALCDALATGARLRVEDVQNGVAIVAQPKAGTNLSTVREDARRLENAIHANAPTEGAPTTPGAVEHATRGGETCGLADLARLPSVTTHLTEGGNSVRLMMTTSNPNEVRDLRRITRDELNALLKAHGGAQGQHQGGQRGTRQQGQQRQQGQGQQGQGQQRPQQQQQRDTGTGPAERPVP
ncbi:Hypothetical protein A7982_10864 [Minicystis rosea]|nr:Hypothetical protein A7982_10864 [Minicystis rosea]